MHVSLTYLSVLLLYHSVVSLAPSPSDPDPPPASPTRFFPDRHPRVALESFLCTAKFSKRNERGEIIERDEQSSTIVARDQPAAEHRYRLIAQSYANASGYKLDNVTCEKAKPYK